MMSGILNVRGALAGQRYTLLRPLTDGSSVLFEARGDGLPADCVVRLFPETGAGTEAARRIEAGARAASGLRLAEVARVLDFNGIEQPVFVAMERVGGRSLEQVMAEDGIFPLPQATEIVGQIAGALAAGHAIGICHGDLHPGAIRLTMTETGRSVTKVIGLGWAGEARSPSGDHRRAVYRAPEQRHESLTYTEIAAASADQFALAAIAYEMLAGCSYVSEESSDLADPESRRWRQPPLIAEMVLGLPAGVDEVLRRALSYEPGARFAGVREFARALSAVTDAEDRVTPALVPVPTNRVSQPVASGDRDNWPTPPPQKAALPKTASGGRNAGPPPPPAKALSTTVRSQDLAPWRTPTSVFESTIDVADMMPIEIFAPPAQAPLPGMPPAPFFAGVGGFMSPALAIPKMRLSGLSRRTQRLLIVAGAALAIAAGGIVVSHVNQEAPVTAAVVLPPVERRTEPTVEPLALAATRPRDRARAVAAAVTSPAHASSKNVSRVGKRKYKVSRHHARARHRGGARDRGARDGR